MISICIVIILLFAESINLPPVLQTLLNLFSYSLISYLVITRFKNFIYVATQNIYILLLALLAIASTYWSVSPSDTFEQVRAAIRSILLGVYIAMYYPPKEQIRLLTWVCGIAIGLSFLLVIFLPHRGLSWNGQTFFWQGIFSHKQSLGRFMSFSVSIFLINCLNQYRYRILSFLGLAASLVLIIMSKSTTGIVCFLLLIALLPFYSIIQQRKTRALMLLSILLMITFAAIFASINLETIVVDVLNKDFEGNGRTPIWNLAIEKCLEKPFLGYGYNAFWTSDYGKFIINNTWAALDPNFTSGLMKFHAHNSFIDLSLQLGFVGLGLFLLSLCVVFHRLIKIVTVFHSLEHFWMLQFIAIYLVYNMTEGLTILATNNILWTTYVAIAFSSTLDYQQMKQQQLVKVKELETVF